MKQISLSQGKSALVSDEDFEYLSKWKWQCDRDGYAVRHTKSNGNKTIRMHRVIAERAGLDIKGREVDHINQNKVDNQRKNVRSATHAENMRNVGNRVDNTSGFKGVSWDKKSRLWHAQISRDGKRVSIGYFNTREQAAAAYDKEAIKLQGDFACPNNVGCEYVEPHKKNTSGFRGVCWCKHSGKWMVRVKDRFIGRFADKIEAAKAYNAAALRLIGEYAYQNVI